MPPYIKTVTSSFMLLLIYINLYKIKKGIRRCPFRNKRILLFPRFRLNQIRFTTFVVTHGLNLTIWYWEHCSCS